MKQRFSPAQSILQSTAFLQELQGKFTAYFNLTPDKVSLSYYQYYQLAAAAYSYKPDLVIELGRAYGNSTFVFTETMSKTGGKVISLCNKNDWQETIMPKIANLIDKQWLAHLDARTVNNMVQVDLTNEIKKAGRTMIFWDAHGFQTAEYVLGHLLPLMKDKDCLILMHDVTDVRFNERNNDYGNQRIWRPETANQGASKVQIGNYESSSDQLISVLDFCTRNKLELNSADESFHEELTKDDVAKIQEGLGDGFSLHGHWVFLQLEKEMDFGKMHFPEFNRELILREDKIKERYLAMYNSKPTIFSRLKAIRELLFLN